MLINTTDVTQDMIEKLLEDESQKVEHFGLKLYGFFKRIGEFINFYNKEKQMQTVRVKIDVVPLNWMRSSSDENIICSLIPIVHQLLVDDKMFATPFVKEALLELAVLLNKEVFNWFFLPFLVQLFFTVIYFGMFALSEKQDWTFALVTITFVVVLMNTFFLWVEYL